MKTLINKLSLEGEISNFGVCQKRKRKSKTKKKINIASPHNLWRILKKNKLSLLD